MEILKFDVSLLEGREKYRLWMDYNWTNSSSSQYHNILSLLIQSSR